MKREREARKLQCFIWRRSDAYSYHKNVLYKVVKMCWCVMWCGVQVLSGLLGGLASYAITSQMNGMGGLRAWQWLFLLEGLPGIFLCIYLSLLSLYLSTLPLYDISM